MDWKREVDDGGDVLSGDDGFWLTGMVNRGAISFSVTRSDGFKISRKFRSSLARVLRAELKRQEGIEDE